MPLNLPNEFIIFDTEIEKLLSALSILAVKKFLALLNASQFKTSAIQKAIDSASGLAKDILIYYRELFFICEKLGALQRKQLARDTLTLLPFKPVNLKPDDKFDASLENSLKKLNLIKASENWPELIQRTSIRLSMSILILLSVFHEHEPKLKSLYSTWPHELDDTALTKPEPQGGISILHELEFLMSIPEFLKAKEENLIQIQAPKSENHLMQLRMALYTLKHSNLSTQIYLQPFTQNPATFPEELPLIIHNYVKAQLFMEQIYQTSNQTLVPEAEELTKKSYFPQISKKFQDEKLSLTLQMFLNLEDILQNLASLISFQSENSYNLKQIYSLYTRMLQLIYKNDLVKAIQAQERQALAVNILEANRYRPANAEIGCLFFLIPFSLLNSLSLDEFSLDVLRALSTNFKHLIDQKAWLVLELDIQTIFFTYVSSLINKKFKAKDNLHEVLDFTNVIISEFYRLEDIEKARKYALFRESINTNSLSKKNDAYLLTIMDFISALPKDDISPSTPYLSLDNMFLKMLAQLNQYNKTDTNPLKTFAGFFSRVPQDFFNKNFLDFKQMFGEKLKKIPNFLNFVSETFAVISKQRNDSTYSENFERILLKLSYLLEIPSIFDSQPSLKLELPSYESMNSDEEQKAEFKMNFAFVSKTSAPFVKHSNQLSANESSESAISSHSEELNIWLIIAIFRFYIKGRDKELNIRENELLVLFYFDMFQLLRIPQKYQFTNHNSTLVTNIEKAFTNLNPKASSKREKLSAKAMLTEHKNMLLSPNISSLERIFADPASLEEKSNSVNKFEDDVKEVAKILRAPLKILDLIEKFDALYTQLLTDKVSGKHALYRLIQNNIIHNHRMQINPSLLKHMQKMAEYSNDANEKLFIHSLIFFFSEESLDPKKLEEAALKNIFIKSISVVKTFKTKPGTDQTDFSQFEDLATDSICFKPVHNSLALLYMLWLVSCFIDNQIKGRIVSWEVLTEIMSKMAKANYFPPCETAIPLPHNPISYFRTWNSILSRYKDNYDFLHQDNEPPAKNFFVLDAAIFATRFQSIIFLAKIPSYALSLEDYYFVITNIWPYVMGLNSIPAEDKASFLQAINKISLKAKETPEILGQFTDDDIGFLLDLLVEQNLYTEICNFLTAFQHLWITINSPGEKESEEYEKLLTLFEIRAGLRTKSPTAPRLLSSLDSKFLSNRFKNISQESLKFILNLNKSGPGKTFAEYQARTPMDEKEFDIAPPKQPKNKVTPKVIEQKKDLVEPATIPKQEILPTEEKIITSPLSATVTTDPRPTAIEPVSTQTSTTQTNYSDTNLTSSTSNLSSSPTTFFTPATEDFDKPWTKVLGRFKQKPYSSRFMPNPASSTTTSTTNSSTGRKQSTQTIKGFAKQNSSNSTASKLFSKTQNPPPTTVISFSPKPPIKILPRPAQTTASNPTTSTAPTVRILSKTTSYAIPTLAQDVQTTATTTSDSTVGIAPPITIIVPKTDSLPLPPVIDKKVEPPLPAIRIQPEPSLAVAKVIHKSELPPLVLEIANKILEFSDELSVSLLGSINSDILFHRPFINIDFSVISSKKFALEELNKFLESYKAVYDPRTGLIKFPLATSETVLRVYIEVTFSSESYNKTMSTFLNRARYNSACLCTRLDPTTRDNFEILGLDVSNKLLLNYKLSFVNTKNINFLDLLKGVEYLLRYPIKPNAFVKNSFANSAKLFSEIIETNIEGFRKSLLDLFYYGDTQTITKKLSKFRLLFTMTDIPEEYIRGTVKDFNPDPDLEFDAPLQQIKNFCLYLIPQFYLLNSNSLSIEQWKFYIILKLFLTEPKDICNVEYIKCRILRQTPTVLVQDNNLFRLLDNLIEYYNKYVYGPRYQLPYGQMLWQQEPMQGEIQDEYLTNRFS